MAVDFSMFRCVWDTCLRPIGQPDVSVLRQIRDAIWNDEVPLVEGWERSIRWLRCFSCLCWPQKALTERLIDAETVHGPVLKNVLPQSQIGHKTLHSKSKRQAEE